MYQKPVIYQTEDLAEGVYAASGSDQNQVTFRAGTFQPYWSGNPDNGKIDYTVTIPSAFSGGHVVMTLKFRKAISNCYGMGSVTCAGTSATADVWGVPSNGTFTVQSSEGDPGLVSISIRKA